VELKDLVSEDVHSFDVSRWLSRYEDDYDVCREIAVAKPGVQPLPRKTNAISCPLINSNVTNVSS